MQNNQTYLILFFAVIASLLVGYLLGSANNGDGGISFGFTNPPFIPTPSNPNKRIEILN